MVKLLVPLDQTADNGAILDLAAQAAERLQADVHLMTVIAPGPVQGTFEPGENILSSFALVPAADATGRAIESVTAAYLAGPAGTMVETRDRALRRAQETARDKLHDLARAFPMRSIREAVCVHADPARRIGRYAVEEGIDLLVMAIHGRIGVGRTLLGSVADTVVRETAKPVLLLGPGAGSARPRLQSLLLCVDGSPLAETILPVLAYRARALQLRVVLVQVMPPSSGTGRDAPEPGYVQRLGSLLLAQGVDAAWAVLHGGEPAAAIASYAAQLPGPIIALSTHGRTGLPRLVRGSVAMRLVAASPAPVLVFHPQPSGAGRDAAARQRLPVPWYSTRMPR